MTTLSDRPNTALLIVDLQRGVVAGAYQRDPVVDNVALLVARARREAVPVLWIQHVSAQLTHGSDEWRIVPELMPSADEPHIEKAYGDAFEGTDLESVLSRLKIGRLVVVGAQTDACIRSTIHGAFVRGYDVTLVGDAHTTDKVIAHTNLYWAYQEAPGRRAETVETHAVEFGRLP
jgi:nicotinamidase-related amidase